MNVTGSEPAPPASQCLERERASENQAVEEKDSMERSGVRGFVAVIFPTLSRIDMVPQVASPSVVDTYT